MASRGTCSLRVMYCFSRTIPGLNTLCSAPSTMCPVSFHFSFKQPVDVAELLLPDRHISNGFTSGKTLEQSAKSVPATCFELLCPIWSLLPLECLRFFPNWVGSNDSSCQVAKFPTREVSNKKWTSNTYKTRNLHFSLCFLSLWIGTLRTHLV